MRLRTRIASKITGAATTTAAYVVIGAESARRNVNMDNARKFMVNMKGAAVNTGKSVVNTARQKEVQEGHRH